MSDNYSQATYSPFIPGRFVSEEDLEFITSFGVCWEREGEEDYYFFEPEYCTTGYTHDSAGNEVEHEEEELLERFQQIVKRANGELPWITRETAYSCSKMQPGYFGGSAVFITADDIKYSGTSDWLRDKIKEATP